MSNNDTSENYSPTGFQFDEATLELLRRGDEKSYDKAIEVVYGYFDQLARSIRRYGEGLLQLQDCEDAVSEFFAGKVSREDDGSIVQRSKFSVLLERYRDKPAAEFNALFYASLRHHASDWVRKVLSDLKRRKDLDETQADPALPKTGLEEEEYAELVKGLRTAIADWAGKNEFHRWVLEAAFLKLLSPKEIASLTPTVFPGKVIALASVSPVLTHFRGSPQMKRFLLDYYGFEQVPAAKTGRAEKRRFEA